MRNENLVGVYARLLEAQGHKCFYCRQHLFMALATRDHVVPRSAPRNIRRNVRHWHQNIVLSCRRCNGIKGGRMATVDEIIRARDLWRIVEPWRRTK